MNGGWAVAHTTLGNERAMIGGGGAGRNSDDIIALARNRGVTDDPCVRQEIVQAYIRSATLALHGAAAPHRDEQGPPTGCGGVGAQARVLAARGAHR